MLCGDMNWNEEEDGEVPLQPGWGDAWTDLHPHEVKGSTIILYCGRWPSLVPCITVYRIVACCVVSCFIILYYIVL